MPAGARRREKAPGSAKKAQPAQRGNAADVLAGVRLTHPDRILWEGQGITTHGLAEFCVEIADWILPHLVGRHLSILRCPTGSYHHHFYVQHARTRTQM